MIKLNDKITVRHINRPSHLKARCIETTHHVIGKVKNRFVLSNLDDVVRVKTYDDGTVELLGKKCDYRVITK